MTDPPPHNLDAEESLLGAIMLAGDALRACHEVGIVAADFYKPAHGTIYSACLAVEMAGARPDPTTVGAALDRQLESVGGRHELLRIQGTTSQSSNAEGYAVIVATHARARRLMALGTELTDTARDGGDVTAVLDRARDLGVTGPARRQLIDGRSFVSATPNHVPSVWGADDRVLWARGETLMLCGPSGVGKTTISAQLVAASIGIGDRLLDLPVAEASRVLYLACDRPSQLQRVFKRLFGDDHGDVLEDRLTLLKGPPPRDLAKHPEDLLALARDAGADRVFIDSLKDVALGLSDDDVGGGVNQALQRCLAEGVDACVLHHQRKQGQAGAKPRTLADVYGSTWITAGVGSVVLLWGEPGNQLVELTHLKQPAAEVGPLRIDHDHNTGRTTVERGEVDPLRLLSNALDGVTARDLAMIQTEKSSPNENEIRSARRTLDRLRDKGLAHKMEPSLGGGSGTQPARYYAITPEPAHLDLVAEENELAEVF